MDAPIASISTFFDNELSCEVVPSLFLKCLKADMIARIMKNMGINIILKLSSNHNKTRVEKEVNMKPMKNDKTKVSSLVKYFLSLQIFTRAYPARNAVQAKTIGSCTIVSI